MCTRSTWKRTSLHANNLYVVIHAESVFCKYTAACQKGCSVGFLKLKNSSRVFTSWWYIAFCAELRPHCRQPGNAWFRFRYSGTLYYIFLSSSAFSAVPCGVKVSQRTSKMDSFYLASLLVHTILTFGFPISAWSVSPKTIKLLKKKTLWSYSPLLAFLYTKFSIDFDILQNLLSNCLWIDHGHFRIDSTYAAIITTGNVHLRLGFLRKIVWYGPN
jgi:hypothetical protein